MPFGRRYSLQVTSIAVVASLIGTVAAILGLTAERKRINAEEVVWDSYTSQCIMPPNKTVSLSITAAFLLLLVQVSLTVAGGCLCCNYRVIKYASPAPLAIKSLVVSWVLCIVAVIFYSYGAGVSNNYHAKPNPKPVLPAATAASCGYSIDSGVFAGAALITLVATASAITYYLAASRVYIHSSVCHPRGGIEVGQLIAPATPTATIPT